MTKSTKSICCHCSVKCGVLIDTTNDIPTRIRGDSNHPLSQGFICPRGRAAIEYFRHPNRLNTPLKRIGKRGEDRWQEVSWEEALDDIANRLGALRDRYGAETIAYLTGTFHGTDQGAGIRFMNLLGSPNYGGTGFICAGPKLVAESLLFGFGPAQADIQPGITQCIIIWGHRPSASRPRFWGKVLAAKRSGATLIVIDPVETAEAKAADLWLNIRPNTDAALALGLLHVIVRDALYDTDFLNQWTLGFDELSERVKLYSPSIVSQITGLSIETITQAAQMAATPGPTALAQGLPNGMGRNALSYELAKSILIAITGNLNKSGGNRLSGPPEHVLTKTDLELYDRLPPTQRMKRLGGNQFPLHTEGYERISAAQMRRWPQHQRVLTASYGAVAHPPSIFRAIRDEAPYPVKALIIQHNNAIGCYPNATLVRDALKSANLDLLVVHELFMTPTAMFADYVMPAASWMEKPYLYVSGQDGLILGTPRVISPQFERRSDYAFFRDLGMRLEQTTEWPATLEAVWDEMLLPAGLTFSDLVHQEQNWLDDSDQFGDHNTLDPLTHQPIGFATPSGKVELSSSILAAIGADALPHYEETPRDYSENVDYPLILMTGATHLDMTHQDHRQISALRRRHPEPIARLHPETAAEAGLVNGDWTWIESPQGCIRQRVQLSERIAVGTVDAERWWYPEQTGAEPELFGVLDSNVNVLTTDAPERCDPIYGAWPFREARCRLVKC